MDSTTTSHHAGHGHSNHGVDHSAMDHSAMNHGDMDHSAMDHGDMDHSGMDHSNMGHGGHGSGHSMQMSFYAGNECMILFAGWITATWGQLFGSCAVVLIAAVLYEGLKSFRERLLKQARAERKQNRGTTGSAAVPTDENHVDVVKPPRDSSIFHMFSAAHLTQTLLHIVQVALSYVLMLVVMTYNVWLCLAVVLGAGLGYFAFGWKRLRIVDSNEHCH